MSADVFRRKDYFKMKQSQNKANRWLARIGGGFIVLCLAAGGFWYWINIPPQIKIPTPVMPHPNGYDYFVRAGKAYVEDTKGVDESTDNSIINKGKKYPLAAKEAWLKKNAKAFQLLREGLKYPTLHPPVRSGKFDLKYGQFRDLARALVVESHARAEHDNWNGAVQSALDDYHFGNQIARGGPLIAGLMSVAIRAISLRELGNLVSHTNAKTAKMAAARMEKFYEQKYHYFETLQVEKWMEQSEYLHVMSVPSWRINTVYNLNHPFLQAFGLDTDDSSSRIKNAQMLVISKCKLMNDLTKLMDALIENAHRPYIKQIPIDTSGNPLVDMMLPVYKRSRWNWARNDTFAVEIMTMYALRAYKLDHGRYPENLSALEPSYLSKIPSDPFDGMHSLHYQLQGNKYLLWSIGPDGADNHGKPIVNPYRNGRRYSFTSPDSKGDVVAGINMP
jgi:hypothetical protein